MRLQVSQLLSVMATTGGVFSPVLLAVAAGLAMLAADSVAEATNAVSSHGVVAQEKGGQVQLERTKITKQQATAVAERLVSLVPGVSVATSAGDGLVLAVKTPEQFPEFMAAIAMVAGSGASVRWEAESVCMNVCQSGNAAQIRLNGFMEKVRVEHE